MSWLDKLLGTASLHKAAEKGELQQVKRFVERGVDVNLQAPTADCETPLLRAASEGHLEVVQFLIDNGANVNAQTTGGGTALHYATSHLEVVRLLINHGADVNAEGYKGATPLHYAAVKGNVEVVCLLIEKGADVNAKDLSGQTPFRLAAREGHVEVGQALFVAGAEEPLREAKERLGKQASGEEYIEKEVEKVMQAAFAGTAQTSERGHPVCPQCGHEFPISIKVMQKQSSGQPAFMCPRCKKMIRF